MKAASKMSMTELRSELIDARRLLAEAKCPRDCDNGIINRGRLRENWHRCPFCAMRLQLIGNE